MNFSGTRRLSPAVQNRLVERLKRRKQEPCTAFRIFLLGLICLLVGTASASAQQRLGILGDSLSAGIGGFGQYPNWHTQIANTGQINVTHNLAENGADSFDVLGWQLGTMEAAIAGGSVDLVTLMIGGNDPALFYSDLLTGNTTGFVNTVSSNINTTLSRLDGAGTAPIVWANIPDITVTPIVQEQLAPFGATAFATARNAISQVNQISQEFALSHGIPVVDLYSMSQNILTAPFQIAGVTESNFFTNDTFHPDPLAHGLMGNAIIEAFNRGYGEEFAPISDQQLALNAGFSPESGDATFFDVSNYVISPNPLSAPTNVVFTVDSSQSSVSVAFPGFSPQAVGSDIATLDGHFLVEFDPLSNNPDSIQFQGGHGFLDARETGQWRPGSPYDGESTVAADFGIQSGQALVATRDVVWDWESDTIAVDASTGTFSATDTGFKVLSLQDIYHDLPFYGSGILDSTGYSDLLTSGEWTIESTAPGSWQLSLAGSYVDEIGRTWTFNVVSNAEFGLENIDLIESGGDVTASALGGSNEAGAVGAAFSGAESGGLFKAQRLESPSSLSSAALAAAEQNSVFAASTAELSLVPQLWSVNFTDDLGEAVGFDAATLLFTYDDSVFAPGFDESRLGIWHYSSTTGEWEFGGIVDPEANTIEFTVSSFSEFQLGVLVPEPSSFALASMAIVGGLIFVVRRRNAAGVGDGT